MSSKSQGDESIKTLGHGQTCEPVLSAGGESLATGQIKPKVHFKRWQTLGMNFSITATPVAIGTYLSLVMGLGGTPYYIWGFVFAAGFQLVVGLVVAEIASAIPHSSGKLTSESVLKESTNSVSRTRLLD